MAAAPAYTPPMQTAGNDSADADTASGPTGAAGASGRRTYSTATVIGVLAATGVTVSLMQTLVIPLMPRLPELFDTTVANASWIITSTLLVAAIAMPVMGRLGDMFGKQRMLLFCIASLGVSSLVCALGTALPIVVFGRGLQGFGIGAIPLGISLMRDILPPRKLAGAVALMSSSLGAGGALGLPISAFIADRWGWAELFWFATAVAVVLLVAAIIVIPESPVRVGGKVDLVGTAGLTVGLGSLLLVVSKGGSWGWTSSTSLGLLGVAVVVLAAWSWWELRVDSPIVDLRTSAHRPVLMTNLAAVMAGFTMYAMNLLAPQLLLQPEVTGYGAGVSLMQAGLWLAPGGFVMVAMSQVAAKVTVAFGARTSLIIGVLTMSAGNVFALSVLGLRSPWAVVAFGCIVSVGVSFAYSALPTIIMEHVPLTETAGANGVNALARSMGTSMGSAVVAAVLAQMTVVVGGHTFTSMSGMRAAFIIAAGSGICAAALAWGIPAATKAEVEDLLG